MGPPNHAQGLVQRGHLNHYICGVYTVLYVGLCAGCRFSGEQDANPAFLDPTVSEYRKLAVLSASQDFNRMMQESLGWWWLEGLVALVGGTGG